MQNSNVFAKEEKFHDEWANNVDVEALDIVKLNTSFALPEIRYIHRFLKKTSRVGGEKYLQGKKIHDVGCGLGQYGIYFASKGADVTGTDISDGVLEVARALAQKNGVQLSTHKSPAEELCFETQEQFDIVFAAFMMHHVDIEKTLLRIKDCLKPDGMFICSEPLAYNPIINIYRKISKDLHSEDEHPLTRKDVKTIKKHFANVKVKYFWLFSLIVYVLLALFHSAKKVPFWSKLIEKDQSWKWLLVPMQKLDSVVLTLFPFLGWWCNNIVIIASNKK